MDELKLRYQTTIQAIKSLGAILELHKKGNSVAFNPLFVPIEDQKNILQDSLIQRFEYSVDTVWKYLKFYFSHHYGIALDSPKPIFRYCLTAGLVSEYDVELLINMVNDRNLPSHTYQQALAQQIVSRIDGYYVIMKKLLNKTSI